jgi:hypothetical protein
MRDGWDAKSFGIFKVLSNEYTTRGRLAAMSPTVKGPKIHRNEGD